MARPRKNTVDYFPHYAKHGKTLFILESRYGNDGYAFWFKLLETLCSTDGHTFDARNPENMTYLSAIVKSDEARMKEMLDLLANLGAIDKALWSEGLIWSDNLIENIQDAYRKRLSSVPEKPKLNAVNGLPKPGTGFPTTETCGGNDTCSGGNGKAQKTHTLSDTETPLPSSVIPKLNETGENNKKPGSSASVRIATDEQRKRMATLSEMLKNHSKANGFNPYAFIAMYIKKYHPDDIIQALEGILKVMQTIGKFETGAWAYGSQVLVYAKGRRSIQEAEESQRQLKGERAVLTISSLVKGMA